VQHLDASNPADAVLLLRMPDTESEWNDGKENDEIEMTKLEAMTRLRAATARQANDQMTNDRDVASSSFGFRLPRRSSPQRPKAGASFVIRHSCFVISLMLIFQTCCAALSHAQSPNMIGTWKVDITFTNGDHRSLRFDAQGAGKGTFLLLDPKLNVWGPAKPSEAKWSRGEGNSVTFSGAVEFLLGNVGRDAGTLVFKGKFETESLITGEVEFSPLVGDRPSKSGTFKAVRAAGG
jgi:hypothetical protein